MKRSLNIILLAFLILPVSAAFAQGVESNLKEARASYGKGDLDAARFALQEALNEVDIVIGNEIMKLLPTSMGNMPYAAEDDVVGAGTLGYSGLFLNRNFGKGQPQTVELSIIADSPLLKGINTILALPVFAADPNQKRVRIGGYRGLLQKTESETGQVDWALQIPFGSSLLSLNFKGISDEKTVTDMAATIPIDQIARLIQ
jgi:hypothetical protein